MALFALSKLGIELVALDFIVVLFFFCCLNKYFSADSTDNLFTPIAVYKGMCESRVSVYWLLYHIRSEIGAWDISSPNQF